MPQFISSFFKRFKALGDKSALFLIIPAVAALFFIDAAMVKTLVQWLIFAPIIAGVAIMVSRVVFPQVNLTQLVKETHEGNKASAILAGALLLFVGVLVYALVTWAKA
jgi:uncharacterized membrane protein